MRYARNVEVVIPPADVRRIDFERIERPVVRGTVCAREL